METKRRQHGAELDIIAIKRYNPTLHKFIKYGSLTKPVKQ